MKKFVVEPQVSQTGVKQIMNCPRTTDWDHRLGTYVVDEETCGGCMLRGQGKDHGKCIYSLVNIPVEREPIFDKESKTTISLFRFKCGLCNHPTVISTFWLSLPHGIVGRCSNCGAFHYFVKWYWNKEGGSYWFAVSGKSAKSVHGVEESEAKKKPDRIVIENNFRTPNSKRPNKSADPSKPFEPAGIE